MPARRPLPRHLPRERVVYPSPCTCERCGSTRLRKLGEIVTESLECEPRRWKVIEHVRETMTCRDCEAIGETPAPSHPIPRGRAGPHLLARVLTGKYADHLPLNRQSEIFAREGIDLEVSTLADWVGACAASLEPIVERIRAHVLAAERLHADDTTIPILAKGKTVTGRLWTYVRDDRPFGGSDPPAAVFFASRDRTGAHPETHLAGYTGIMQADAYAGFNRLYEPGRNPGPIVEAGCFAHARRKLFDLAKVAKAPIAAEAVTRIDALFAIEREINGRPAAERLAVRQAHLRPLIDELEIWLIAQRQKLSTKSELAKAITYSLKRWTALTRFLDDGRICMTNNAAERALRGVAVGAGELDLRRLGPRCRARRHDLHPDDDLQAEPHRPAGLHRRRPRKAAGPSRPSHRRAHAVGLASTRNRASRLSSTSTSNPPRSAVFTGCVRSFASVALRK